MDLLLDTHILLWYITGDKKLTTKIVKTIDAPENRCFISIMSLWEIVIKLSLDKLEIKGGFETIENFLSDNDVEILPVSITHTKNLLKLKNYHRDPFDRMIISQAQTDNLFIVTKDKIFKKYGVKIIC